MNRSKAMILAAVLGLLTVATAWKARADQWDKKTVLTVNEQIQIPGSVLQPGEYVMKLADSQSNRHIVQVFNKDETQLITTILAIPNYRLQPTGDSKFGFWEMPAGQAKALRSWFYPGDNFGQEFAYPKESAVQIAQANKQSVPALEGSDVKTAGIGKVEGQRSAEQDRTVMAQERSRPSTATPSPEAPPYQATTPPAGTEAPASSELPKTGSFMPLVGLGGLLSLGAAAALRLISKS